MKITKVELKNKYGIDLPSGLYSIKKSGDCYTINTVKDDTDGCLLTGRNTEVGKVLESRATFEKLMKEHLLPAYNRGETIKITIS